MNNPIDSSIEDILLDLMNSVTGDGKYKRLPSMTKEEATAQIKSLITTELKQLLKNSPYKSSVPNEDIEKKIKELRKQSGK